MRRTLFVTVLMVLAAMSLPFVSEAATAHSPTFPGNNTSLANATVVENPSKSWAIYSHLEEGTYQYFAVDLKAGDRLYLNLIVPTHEKGSGFQPDMIILGPFSGRNGSVPTSVDIPTGYGLTVINGSYPDRTTYEAFSPGAFLNLATFDGTVPANGRYYVVVFQDASVAPIHGDYGLAVGYVESFTLTEFILIPFSLLNVYQWEGQSPAQIFAPMLAVFVIGLLGLYLWKKELFSKMGLAQGFALIAGLLFLGTALNTAIQTSIAVSQAGLVLEVLLTLLFIVTPLLIGWIAIRMALSRSPWEKRRRVMLLIIGILGLLSWGGLIVGPIFAMVGSVLPGKRH
jgi:hypothetical protein